MLRRLLPDPFIILLLATMLLATVLPARGAAVPAVNAAATGAIVLLFFFHGAKLSRRAVLQGLAHWRLHLVILAFTFVLFPLLGLGLATALPGLLTPALWTGVLFLVALPSTVQSSIAFTSMARGNVPAAIASASASQVLGVLMTPLLVGLLIGAWGADMSVSGIGNIVLQILVPFVAGHALRPWLAAWVQKHRAVIGISDRTAIVLAVYTAFSAAAVAGIWSQLPVSALLTVLALCALILALVLLASRQVARRLGFSREDEIAIVFCGTKKSLVQGVPMARVLFAGPDLGLILMPLMIFHQLQLMVCAWLARRYADREDLHEPEQPQTLR